jgi:RNA polymerase sigma-70 factor (ECF subfamily)
LSEDSFENLVNEHGRQVLNTALRVLGDVNLANDVHQEVFMAIWKRWPRYNGHTNWPAYLYRATVRKALQTARRRNGYQTAMLPEREDANQRPESDLRADELRQKLAVALAKLPKRQADVFVLRRLEGLETAEVARLLGCSPQTVSVHLHRALRKLSRALSAYLG